MELTFRTGTLDDIDFATETLIEAEKGVGIRSSWENIFSLSRQEIKELFTRVLEENIPGSEFCVENYLLACDGPKVVGGISAWVEPGSGPGSHFIKTALLSKHAGKELWMKALPKLEIVAHGLNRTPNTLQFEDGYVIRSYRGNRILSALHKFGYRRYLEKYPALTAAQAFMVKGNMNSTNPMVKQGWKIIAEKPGPPGFDEIMPGKSILHWEIDLSPFKNPS